jgi:phospholipid transport system substrate-binding protein
VITTLPRRRRLLSAGLPALFALVLALPGAHAQDSVSPTAVVKATIGAVLEIARRDGPPAAQREEALAVVRRHFDFKSMSRRVLATHWARATPVERERFVALFTELLIRSYWRKIANYRGAPVEVVSERIREARYATVATVVQTGQARVPVDYRLQRTERGWQAYDVAIEQVSLVRNYRGSFQDIDRQEGVAALLRQLEDKVAALPP